MQDREWVRGSFQEEFPGTVVTVHHVAVTIVSHHHLLGLLKKHSPTSWSLNFNYQYYWKLFHCWCCPAYKRMTCFHHSLVRGAEWKCIYDLWIRGLEKIWSLKESLLSLVSPGISHLQVAEYGSESYLWNNKIWSRWRRRATSHLPLQETAEPRQVYSLAAFPIWKVNSGGEAIFFFFLNSIQRPYSFPFWILPYHACKRNSEDLLYTGGNTDILLWWVRTFYM